MIISGTPCIDFSSSGACMGEYGNTGWMFSAQAEPILLLSPNSFCIEMVANCLKVNGGRAFKSLVSQLETQYVIKHEVIRTMEHGDSSNRTRVFIVGLHKRLGDVAHSFVFPTGDAPPAPARSQAVPDHLVPEKYWRYYDTPLTTQDPRVHPGRLHRICQLRPGMGHSSWPHAIYSWDGTWNTQTTHNGGGMRPPLNWKKGDPLWKTRLTTPIESVRVALLPDSYLPWVRTFDKDDKFLFECVNMGVPICTASSIYDIITTCLNQAKIPPSTPLPKELRVPRGSKSTEQWDQEVSEWPDWAPETAHARRASDTHCKAKGRKPTAWHEHCFSGGRPPEPDGSSLRMEPYVRFEWTQGAQLP